MKLVERRRHVVRVLGVEHSKRGDPSDIRDHPGQVSVKRVGFSVGSCERRSVRSRADTSSRLTRRIKRGNSSCSLGTRLAPRLLAMSASICSMARHSAILACVADGEATPSSNAVKRRSTSSPPAFDKLRAGAALGFAASVADSRTGGVTSARPAAGAPTPGNRLNRSANHFVVRSIVTGAGCPTRTGDLPLTRRLPLPQDSMTCVLIFYQNPE